MQRTYWPALAAVALATAACSDQPTNPALQATPATTRIAPLLGLSSPNRIPGKYVVVFKDNVRDARGVAAQITGASGARPERVFAHALKGFSAALPEQAVEALRRNPNVAYVEAEYMLQLTNNPSVQSSPGWALDRLDQRSPVRDGSYRYYENGAGVTMYIVDSGVRADHTEFGGRVQTIFDGNSGGTGNDCLGHGTKVASLAAGATLGVAKQAQILSLKVTQSCSGAVPSSYLIDAVNAITARTERPAVVNVSIGKNPQDVQADVGSASAVDDAIQNSINAGITYVVAAGNGSTSACNETPARLPAAITVSAVDSVDHRPAWANYGSCVDLFAPGVDVPVASRSSTTAVTVDSGTSFSAPLAAGVAALYLQANPTASPAQVASALTAGATRWQAWNVNGSPQLIAFSRLVRTRPITLETYRQERYRLTPNGPFIWRRHYLAEQDWNPVGQYHLYDAQGTQTGFPYTTFDATDRNGGALSAGDTITLTNQSSQAMYIWSTSSLLRADGSTVTNGSDRFIIHVVSRASGSPLPTGSGTVGNGTEVALLASTGNYLRYSSGWTAGAGTTLGAPFGDEAVWIYR